MKFPSYARNASRVRFGVASVAAVALLVALPGSAQAAAVPVPLGTAGSFVVLAGAGITNTGPTTLNGNLGTFPTTTVTVTGKLTVNGTNHAGDAVTKKAKTDLVTAYNKTAGEGPTSPISGDLTGRTLKRGVYNSASSIGLTGVLTLDGSGPFVFQAGSALTTGSGSQIRLINGARSCNVFWQIGSSATLGTGSKFVGTIMALTSITATTGATVVGRLLARNGAVTLDTNVITRPTPCATTATTGATGGTGSQVGQVPVGGVSSGDGSTSGDGNGSLGLLSGVLVFAGIGSAAVATARRRRRVNI
jgi:Ice-binding-like